MSCSHRSVARGKGDCTGCVVTLPRSVSQRACLGDLGSLIDSLTPSEEALDPGGGGSFWRMRAVGLDTSSLV